MMMPTREQIAQIVAGHRHGSGVEWKHLGHDYKSQALQSADALVALFQQSAAPSTTTGEWRDIATAPKDHLPILVWSSATGCLVAFRDVTWAWWPVPARHALSDEPTHWRPLPTPPGSASTAAPKSGA